MRNLIVLAALALVVACGDKTTMPGDACPTADNMLCGKSSGTSVAMLCTSHATGPATWSYVTNCGTCDHVTGCQTELICNGVNVANEGLHCDVQNVGACSVNNNAHLLKCDATNTWTLAFDCSTQGKVCGFVSSGNLSCK
jgi:hypothetical protein